jgi:hypothetical protein
VTGEADEPVARDTNGNPVTSQSTGGDRAGTQAGRVPNLGKSKDHRDDLPRRSSGCHEQGRDPGSGLVLAREHQRLRAYPSGQGRHAGLLPVEGHLDRRPVFASAGNLATCAKAAGAASSGKLRSGSAEAAAALSLQGRYQDVAGSLKIKESSSPRTSGSSSASPRAAEATPPSGPG